MISRFSTSGSNSGHLGFRGALAIEVITAYYLIIVFELAVLQAMMHAMASKQGCAAVRSSPLSCMNTHIRKGMSPHEPARNNYALGDSLSKAKRKQALKL